MDRWPGPQFSIQKSKIMFDLTYHQGSKNCSKHLVRIVEEVSSEGHRASGHKLTGTAVFEVTLEGTDTVLHTLGRTLA